MNKFYLFIIVILLFFTTKALSQTCDTVTATYIIKESRCASTGSIQINATGGSGNYQYKVNGPVNTNYTSVSLISGLSSGRYLVTIKDIVSNCVYSNDSVTVPGNYIDPVFSLVATDVTCINGNDGIITATGQNYGRAPFSYKIVAPSASHVGTVSPGGVFTGLIPGNYLIQLSDSCGAIQTRSSTVQNYDWSINTYTVTKIGCDSISVTINLIDSKGNVTPNPVFNLFTYGASKATGDTTWYTTKTFHYYKANKHVVKLFAKDKCGNIKSVTWTDPQIPSVNSNVTISNKACSTFTVKITSVNNMTSPSFCLYNSSNVLISCNTNGTFNNVPYGSYCMKITDICYDTTITRCFTVDRPIPSVNANVLINATCRDFTATVTGQTNLNNPNYCLYNSSNVLMYCNTTGIFPNLPFGQYCIRITNDPACYDTTIVRCFTVTRPLPFVGPNVTILNITCTTFTVIINDTANLNNPWFCLYTPPHVLVSCNSTGVFNNLPFGTYCVDVRNDSTCFDTTITRCFTVNRPRPSLNNSVSISNKTCTTFTATITGQTNINNPNYCLYDNSNVLVSCNTTGVFNNITYGSYCIKTQNNPVCYDTLITRCFTVSPTPVNISLSTNESCTNIGTTDLKVSISSGFPAYNIKLYSPTGSLLQNISTGSATYTFTSLPDLPSGQRYKVVVTDQCGNKDSTTRSPQVYTANKLVTVTQKCPSGILPNGSADVIVNIADNNIGGSIVPKIIKKNGAAVTINASSGSNYVYSFLDLAPATYIFDTYITSCNKHLYDTVTVQFYLYPTLTGSKAYQCDNNSFTVNGSVSGGTGPYLYEIIGSVPDSPSIVRPPQASPVFTINNGTTYSLIRLRVVDACGNAALQDASVLPLANFIVSSDSLECFNHKLILRVELIPNAVYTWYKRIPVDDSIIVGTGPSYTVPVLLPSDTGRYFCKIVLNNGCLIKFANYVVTGWCGTILPVGVTLSGTKSPQGNKLYWNSVDEGITSYELQRSINNQNIFNSVGNISISGESSYSFVDRQPGTGNNLYRLKIYYGDNKFKYSNIVNIWNTKLDVGIYPNPVRNTLYVSINSNTAKKYSIEMFALSGQKIMSNVYSNVQNIVIQYPKTAAMASGLYTLVITDIQSNEKEVFKIVYQ